MIYEKRFEQIWMVRPWERWRKDTAMHSVAFSIWSYL